MQIQQHLKQAKVVLIRSQPFYASLLLRLPLAENPAIDTLTTDGQCITYAPDYVARLTVDELAGALAHVIMHLYLLHPHRRGIRDLQRWNVATDYAINPILIQDGIKLPANALLNVDYANKTAEQIYELLPDPPANAPGGMGDFSDACTPNKAMAIAHMKQMVAQAAVTARLRGKYPRHLQRLVSDMLTPKIDWQTVLSQFLTEAQKNDYTWTRPCPRYLATGIYLPILHVATLGPIILLVDTSMSIDQPLLNQFAAEVQAILSTSDQSLLILYVDTAVRHAQQLEPGQPCVLEPNGGGGTDFRPGFDYIEARSLQPTAVCYLTDGQCTRFPVPPPYPVLWAQFDTTHFEPPFGQVIQVH